MTSSPADPENLSAQLLATYRKLSVLEQQILQLFSVIYEPIGRTPFTTCFNQTGICDASGKAIAASAIKYRIDKLLQVNLLIQERGEGSQCHPALVEIATREAIQAGNFETLVNAVQRAFPVRQAWKNGPFSFSSDRQFTREVRICIYQNDFKRIQKLLEDYSRYSYSRDRTSLEQIFQLVCNHPFDPAWFKTLSKELYENALFSILSTSALDCTAVDEAFDFLQKEAAPSTGHVSNALRSILVEQLLLRGQLEAAQRNLEALEASPDQTAMYQGWLNFLQGNPDAAIAHYTLALKALRKTTGKRQAFFSTIAGCFFILALLQDGSPARLKEAEDYANWIIKQPNHTLKTTYIRLHSLLKLQQGDLSQRDFLITHIASHASNTSLETLLSAVCFYWADADQAKQVLPQSLESLYQRSHSSGYHWVAMETAELLARLQAEGSYAQAANTLRQNTDIPPLVDLIQRQEAWELCLNALANLSQDPQATSGTEENWRLAWFITYFPSGCFLQPREQKRSANGTWGKGRPISLKRLSTNASEFEYLTAQDRRVCAHIESYYAYGYKPEFKLGEKAIVALIGHPHVFWETPPNARVDIVKGEPELLVKKISKDKLALEFSPRLTDDQNILLIQETPTRIKVLEVRPEHRRIAEIIGKQNHLEVPVHAKERVLSAITAVSGIVTVHSDIGGGAANAEEVPAQAKPHIHLLPAGKGLKITVLTRPFATGGPYYRPGTGGETVIAEIDGKRLQTTRDLEQEQQLADAAIAACPTLEQQEPENGEWLIESPEDCLELLTELRSLRETAVLEWPEGEKLRITHYAGMSNFQLSIQRQNDWFTTTGSLRLDDQVVLNMQQLMELLNHSSSRFIPLGEGQFIALTQAFRKRLDELRAYAEKHGTGMRFHASASMALEEFVDEVGDLEADQHWKAHVKRLKEMKNLQPELPTTLQAELRDYQREGFNWLMQLAHWGMGACLADDMGLGKTLQSLALILARAPQGPTLILAPTSVCMNWISEAQRFAPTLNVIQFGSGNRQTVIDQLQPLDMLVCSYGLLQQDDVAEMLATVQWQTIVLDEAQAIKNGATKRSQAAMKLQGDFKLITTGTPIENHLGELWTLFRFINPGLLGSLEKFNERFAFPIERLQDKQARAQLRKLIQPFILRRTKSQVLQELPSRTEIALHVELSQEERILYEALRRDAIAKLENSDAIAGAKHLQVLAEITRLRRMCCNPRLVMPEVSPASSKLQLFGEVLTELLDNRHKTLVFSQFVDHLQILRDYLEERAIAYQYLDGSTPAKERKKRVDAFQAGKGDVFLISLKAGGTGLNLTAADYVIHMDPWWNPAVEDQASDRAHRFGQQRPVTIYRLITKDTIEEKIVDLHQHKRDLADSLLEGADMSGKISTEELMRLMQTF